MVESQRGLDYWGVLGLEPGADAAALKRAFRDQARRWHPDLNGSDPVAEERFKQVNEAYAVLSDPRKRRAWEEGLAAGGESGAGDPFASGFPDFEAYLDRLFGRVPPEEEPDDPLTYRDNAEAAAAPTEPRQGRWRDSSAAVGRGDVATAPPPPPPVVAATDEETVLNLSPEQALEGSRVELELADGLMVEVSTPPLAGDGWRLRLAGVTPGGGDHFLQLRVRTEEGAADRWSAGAVPPRTGAGGCSARLSGGGAHPGGSGAVAGAGGLLQRPPAASAGKGPAGWTALW